MLVVQVVSKTRIIVIHYTAEDSSKGATMPKSAQETGVSGLGLMFSSGSGSSVQGVAAVIEEEITLDPTSDTVEVVRYNIETYVYPASKAIRRARSKIGEQEYHLFNNNCESMVNWALTGEAISKQGDNAKIVLTGIGVAAGIGIGFAITVGILHALTGGDKKR